MFGKWHLGDTYPYGAAHRGFQYVVRHGAGVVGEGILIDHAYWPVKIAQDGRYRFELSR
jgi:hypothetical protein